MNTIKIKAPAKINLFLDVVGRRPDGYHNINSVMQTVDLCDFVTVNLRNDAIITVKCDNCNIPSDENNIAYKAAKLYFSYINDNTHGCDIFIEKRIPYSAGLAGGSTDAAATLIGLNRLFENKLSIDVLASRSAAIGADIPFCVYQGTKLVEGIGEIVTPLADMPMCHIIIAKAGEGVCTKDAYQNIDALAFSPRDISTLLVAIKNGDLYKIANSCYNAFENVILPKHSEARKIKEIMTKDNAIVSLMSGSGPSVFGIFDNAEYAQKALEILQENRISANICRPL